MCLPLITLHSAVVFALHVFWAAEVGLSAKLKYTSGSANHVQSLQPVVDIPI